MAKHLGDGGGNPFSIPSSAMDRSTKINKAVVNNDTRVAVVEPEEVDLLWLAKREKALYSTS